VYSIVVNSTGATSLGLGIPLWAIVANYLWACNSISIALVECKPGNNTGIIGNFERIVGSFWGIKE